VPVPELIVLLLESQKPTPHAPLSLATPSLYDFPLNIMFPFEELMLTVPLKSIPSA
jgi:hypothetical protein